MRTMIFRALLGIAICILFSSCSNGTSRDDAAADATRNDDPNAADTANVEEPAPGMESASSPFLQEAVTISRSGGIAGYDDVVVIHPDGSVERVRGGEALGTRLQHEKLELLSAALADAANVDTEGTNDVGADQLVYTVETEGRRLQFNEMTDDPRLRSLRDAIQDLFSVESTSGADRHDGTP